MRHSTGIGDGHAPITRDSWHYARGVARIPSVRLSGLGAGRDRAPEVEAKPGTAGVFVDGKYLGPAANFNWAQTYVVTTGSHEVVLREPRYKEVTLKASIESGKTTTLKQKLEPVTVPTPPFGKLKTQAKEKFTGVFVNGMFMGHTDEFDNFAQGLLLKPGDYVVRFVSPDGSRTHEEKVSITADKTTAVRWDGK